MTFSPLINKSKSEDGGFKDFDVVLSNTRSRKKQEGVTTVVFYPIEDPFGDDWCQSRDSFCDEVP